MRSLLISLFLFTTIPVAAQLTVSVPAGPVHTHAQQLAQYLAGPGVSISNVQLTAHEGFAGFFNGENSNLGLNSGVILATGNISNAPGPNTFSQISDETGPLPNLHLDALTQGPVIESTMLEFDIRTSSDRLSLEYVFASEEYVEYVCTEFNDVFGFFISGPGIAGNIPGLQGIRNIALVPGTSNTPVGIGTIHPNNPIEPNCQPENVQYYRSNGAGLTIEYDGLTVVLTAEISGLIPCQVYHLRLAVGDVGDGVVDSAVLLKQASITSPTIALTSNSPTCEGATLNLNLTNPISGATYTWSGPNNFSATGYSVSIAGITAAAAGVYTVSSGCEEVYSSTEIEVLPVPAPPQVATNSPVCQGNTLMIYASGATAGLYSWYGPGISSPASGSDTLVIANVLPNWASAFSVTTIANGCSSQAAVAQAEIIALPPAQPALLTPGVMPGQTLQLSAQPVNGATYAWTGPAGSYSGQLINVPATTAASFGMYSVTVTSPEGCTNTGTILVPFIPNIFTPNGDGVNDVLKLEMASENYDLRIFSRWGKLIFESRNYNQKPGWAAENIPDGLYYYQIKTTKGQEWNGWLEIIR